MTYNRSSEINLIMSTHKDNANNQSKPRILTQEEVDEQIRNYFVPLNKQLKSNCSPKVDKSSSFSAAGTSPESQ